MVPSARLELAQLSPLPPQDSVSTNFTTTAAFKCLNCVRPLADLAFQTDLEFTLKSPGISTITGNFGGNYLDGICAAPDAGVAGTTATGAGAVTAAPSSTLPELAAGRAAPK